MSLDRKCVKGSQTGSIIEEGFSDSVPFSDSEDGRIGRQLPAYLPLITQDKDVARKAYSRRDVQRSSMGADIWQRTTFPPTITFT